MRNILAFLLILAVGLSVGWALTPLLDSRVSGAFPSPATLISDGSGEMVIPVPFGDGGYGGPPITFFDSTLFSDDMEGGHPAWTSADLSVGDFWHIQTFDGFGTNSDVFQCGDPRLADICDTAYGGYNNHWLQYLVLDAVDLSSATTPVFSFTGNYRMEPPGGEPAGYDAWDAWNVWGSTDNGTTWAVLTPTSPGYNCTSSYAFGDEWDMGPGIPGYTDSSAGPGTYTFSLSSLMPSANARVRVAFCSDPAASTADGQLSCRRFGLAVDDLLIEDGASTLYSNTGVPGGWTTATGPQSPDTWSHDASNSHSPTYGYTATIANNLSRGLYSYPVILPAGYQQLKITYWVWADMPDYEGPDTNNYLEDYYNINFSTNDGATWTQSHYDYGNILNGCNTLTDWCLRDQGLSSGAYLPLAVFSRVDASQPETLRIAFEITTDGDDDGGAGGTGLHIDDVTFTASRAFQYDLATRDMIIPLPTTLGITRSWNWRFVNEGIDPGGVPSPRAQYTYFRPGGTFFPVYPNNIHIVSGTLNYGDDTLVTRTMNFDSVGGWRFRTFAWYSADMDHSNDTTWSGAQVSPQNPDRTLGVWVRLAGVYELGYGRRSVANAYLQQRHLHFTPLADGVPAGDAANYDMLQLRVMWRYEPLAVTGATARFRFFEEGVDSFHTGAQFYTFDTEIDSSETIGADGIVRWWTMNLSTIPALHNRSGNFWVSVAALDTVGPDNDPCPLPLGTSAVGVGGPPDGHNYYGPTGGDLTQSGGRVLLNVVIGQAVENLTIHRGVTPSNDIILYWTAAPGASKYYVWRTTTPTQPYNTGTLLTPGGITTNTYTDVGAISATPRFYVVITEY